jgi:hypothetical protein
MINKENVKQFNTHDQLRFWQDRAEKAEASRGEYIVQLSKCRIRIGSDLDKIAALLVEALEDIIGCDPPDYLDKYPIMVRQLQVHAEQALTNHGERGAKIMAVVDAARGVNEVLKVRGLERVVYPEFEVLSEALAELDK